VSNRHNHKPYTDLKEPGQCKGCDSYYRGQKDASDGKSPDYNSLALGASPLNDYERGYLSRPTKQQH